MVAVVNGNSDEKLSFTAAAATIGISERALRNWVRLGRIATFKIGPRRVYVTRDEVQRVLRGESPVKAG